MLRAVQTIQVCFQYSTSKCDLFISHSFISIFSDVKSRATEMFLMIYKFIPIVLDI